MKQMKKNILCTVLSGLAVFAFVGEAVAQPQINRSAYFLGGATYRHELNPAFMGERGSKRFILRHRQTYPISI